LEELLGTPVDVALKTSLKPRIGQQILREVVEI
jgi:predicted nucleotidyltransferase